MQPNTSKKKKKKDSIKNESMNDPISMHFFSYTRKHSPQNE